MKYVDDLSKVKPEEVQHEFRVSDRVLAIVRVPEGAYPFTIVFQRGNSSTYTGDGRYLSHGPQVIVYKPKKVKYLKSIRQILNEFPDAKFDGNGTIRHPSWCECIAPGMFENFGKPLEEKYLDGYAYDKPSWIEEKDG